MKQRDIALLLIPISCVILAWVAFGIYHNFTTTTISDAVFIQIAPINPSFDTTVIKTLKTRQEITSNPTFNTATPSASPTSQPTPTLRIPSLTPSITNKASSSGQLIP